MGMLDGVSRWFSLEEKKIPPQEESRRGQQGAAFLSIEGIRTSVEDTMRVPKEPFDRLSALDQLSQGNPHDIIIDFGALTVVILPKPDGTESFLIHCSQGSFHIHRDGSIRKLIDEKWQHEWESMVPDIRAVDEWLKKIEFPNQPPGASRPARPQHTIESTRKAS